MADLKGQEETRELDRNELKHREGNKQRDKHVNDSKTFQLIGDISTRQRPQTRLSRIRQSDR